MSCGWAKSLTSCGFEDFRGALAGVGVEDLFPQPQALRRDLHVFVGRDVFERAFEAQLHRGRKGDAFAVSKALDTLSTIFKLAKTRLEELLESHVVSDWPADVLSRGAYSYTPVGGLDAMEKLAEPVEDTLFFAGEATHFEGEAGTVAGAIASGYRAASQILAT